MKAKILTAIAIKYAEAGRIDRAFQIFLEAIQIAQTLENQFHKAKTVGVIAYNLAAFGRFTEALQITQTISDEQLYKALALRGISVKLAEAKRFSEALQIASSISLSSEKVCALTKIAAMLFESEQKEKALQILSESLQIAQNIEHCQEKANRLFDIAIVLADAGQLSEAQEIAQTIEDSYKKAWSLVKIAEVKAIVAKLEQWLDIWNFLPSIQDIKNENTKADIFRSITLKLARNGHIEQALQLISKALELEIKLDKKVWLLTSIASEFAVTEKTEQALQLFSKALQIAQTIKLMTTKDNCLGEIAVGFVYLRRWQEALQITKNISDNFYKAEILHSIAVKLIEDGQEKQGSQLLKEAKQIVQSFEPGTKAMILSRMACISVYSEYFSNVLEICQEIVQTIEEDYHRNSALQQIAVALAAKGRFSEALNINSYNAIPDLIKYLCEAGQHDRALEVAQTLVNNAQKASSVIGIADSLIKAGRLNKGFELLEQAQALAERIEN